MRVLGYRGGLDGQCCWGSKGCEISTESLLIWPRWIRSTT